MKEIDGVGLVPESRALRGHGRTSDGRLRFCREACELNEELERLNAEARKLEERIGDEYGEDTGTSGVTSSLFKEIVLGDVLHFSNGRSEKAATQTSKGMKMSRIDWEFLANCIIKVPPSNLPAIFNAFISNIVLKTINITFQIRDMSTNRDLLLLKLFSEYEEVVSLLGRDYSYE